MSRAAIHPDEFTPFGLWIKEYVEQCMTVTNIDYFLMKIEKEIVYAMLIEEKTNNGKLTNAQRMALRFLHNQLMANNGVDYDFETWGIKKIEYWGFYLLKFPFKATMPGPGMTVNDKIITAEQLASHLSFSEKFCDCFFSKK